MHSLRGTGCLRGGHFYEVSSKGITLVDKSDLTPYVVGTILSLFEQNIGSEKLLRTAGGVSGLISVKSLEATAQARFRCEKGATKHGTAKEGS